MAWQYAKDFVKEGLVSPGSADFGGFLEQTSDECVTDLGEGVYVASGWVDAQNLFGAKLRRRFTCRVKYIGDDNWRCESLQIHER